MENQTIKNIITQGAANNQEYAEFEKEWISVQKYEFKILTLVAVLADNNLAYRGTLKDMCEFLGVQAQTNNRNKIKAAIEELVNKEFILMLQDKRTYTLTLKKSAERKSKVIKVQKEWIKLAKELETDKSLSIDWSDLIRVWIYLIDVTSKQEIITNKQIAEELKINNKKVERARAILEKQLSFIQSRARAEKTGENSFKNIGSTIDCKAWKE